ncbi:MAG: peptide chain release factor 2 [Acidimicrobiia bacterium]|nr:peptide chain release factor 2 [Acidimicrobiia bacterium]
MTTDFGTDYRGRLAGLRQRLGEARGFLDLDAKTGELEELRSLAGDPALWDDQERAREVGKRLSRYEEIFSTVEELGTRLDDAEVLLDLAAEADDTETRLEAGTELDEVEAVLARLERESLFFGEYDEHDAILGVHAGAGGVDAQDWAEMMVRMYQRFLGDEGFKVTVEDMTDGDEAGIKSATLTVRGDRAYGNLESERGVHRLVRISPFDANSRRQTSFAGVDVVPEITDDESIEINDDDIRIDTYRAQGAGGQHVNKTDSAVRITHLPTNIVVQCQNERSQLQNKSRAMEILRAKLAEVARQERRSQLDEIRGEQGEAAWGRQIRSYVMQPYQMVKDLRTDVESGNIQAVLDGDLADFVDGYLRWRRVQKEEEDA